MLVTKHNYSVKLAGTNSSLTATSAKTVTDLSEAAVTQSLTLILFYIMHVIKAFMFHSHHVAICCSKILVFLNS